MVVALRMTIRIWIVRSIGWDDYIILCAILDIIIGCALVIDQIHYGLALEIRTLLRAPRAYFLIRLALPSL